MTLYIYTHTYAYTCLPLSLNSPGVYTTGTNQADGTFRFCSSPVEGGRGTRTDGEKKKKKSGGTGVRQKKPRKTPSIKKSRNPELRPPRTRLFSFLISYSSYLAEKSMLVKTSRNEGGSVDSTPGSCEPPNWSEMSKYIYSAGHRPQRDTQRATGAAELSERSIYRRVKYAPFHGREEKILTRHNNGPHK